MHTVQIVATYAGGENTRKFNALKISMAKFINLQYLWQTSRYM